MEGYTAKDIMELRKKTSAGIGLCKEALESSSGDMQKAVEYINSKSDVVSRIYNMTGAKIGLIKIALQDADEDYAKAIEIIKERGWEGDAVDDAEGNAEGMIGSYVHTDKKTVALVEVHCQTDFVAKNDNYIEFANELAKQAAAMKPEYVSKDLIPEEKMEELKDLFTRELKEEGKPEEMIEKIIEGKFNKYYQEKCLMQQKWFKDDSKTMQSLLDEAIGSLGEPISVKRLVVWELGK
jgi:elongation factor Ts